MAKQERKRSLDVSEIEPCLDTATVYGVVTELSPVKVSKMKEKNKYSSGTLSDGRKHVRVVSFNVGLHKDFDESRVSGGAVALVNCEVKEVNSNFASAGERFEVVATKKCRVQQSPEKEFEIVSSSKSDCAARIALKDLV